MTQTFPQPFDLFIIGGGVNGCGIARDAAGRGLRVALAEMNDLGSATSSSSTKLFHGGLRYLEYFEFGLVKSSLLEREVLLEAMPHISWPLRFVLPYHGDMRFDAATPTSKLLSWLMPWMKGRRPAWLIRLGLFLYDHLGGRKILPGTTFMDLRTCPEGAPLQDKFTKAYEYSDCWVEDSRLVVLNARDAQAHGATILTRTKVVSAQRQGEFWRITLQEPQGTRAVLAKALVNAAGPWVEHVIRGALELDTSQSIRLVRGSHIITRKLYDHDKCYFFQGRDGRIIFSIPYEGEFTLIGTTDTDHPEPNISPKASPEEQDYLCAFASEYFKQPLTRADVIWSYSGLRPLFDDGASSASAATRDYVLSLDNAGAPLLNVFGGKITTYRKLAEQVLEKLSAVMELPGHAWTARAPLPGGDFGVHEVEAKISALQADYPFLDIAWAKRLIRAYGTEAWKLLGNARSAADLGQDFGASLTEQEVRWLQRHEYAKTLNDILWRRTKLGLKLTSKQHFALAQWLSLRASESARPLTEA
jgi:glycerol-3-phosphate dehydrogenase